MLLLKTSRSVHGAPRPPRPALPAAGADLLQREGARPRAVPGAAAPSTDLGV